MKTWIIVVNRVEAKIFESDSKKRREIYYLNKLENPRGRLKAHEIDADKPGIFASVLSFGSRFVGTQSPTDRISQMFAKRVVQFLEQARQGGEFDDLILIAEPQFLGKLRNLYSRDLKDVVTKEIPKDLGPQITGKDLKKRLWPHQEGTASI